MPTGPRGVVRVARAHAIFNRLEYDRSSSGSDDDTEMLSTLHERARASNGAAVVAILLLRKLTDRSPPCRSGMYVELVQSMVRRVRLVNEDTDHETHDS